jgi:hypothetical protein
MWLNFVVAEVALSLIVAAISLGAGGSASVGILLLPPMWILLYRLLASPRLEVYEWGVQIVNPTRSTQLLWKEIDRAYVDQGCLPGNGVFFIVGRNRRSYRVAALAVNWILQAVWRNHTGFRALRRLGEAGIPVEPRQ